MLFRIYEENSYSMQLHVIFVSFQMGTQKLHGIPWNVKKKSMKPWCFWNGGDVFPLKSMELGDIWFGDSIVLWNKYSMEYRIEDLEPCGLVVSFGGSVPYFTMREVKYNSHVK